MKDEIKNTYKGFKASVNEIFKGGAVDDIIEDASKLADAKTAAVDMDKVDDTIDSLKAANRLDDIEGGLNSITVKEERLIHSTVGEFNSNGRLINGGHGQSNIDYLEANGIPYNIVKEYPNGVRVGNIPSHKNKFKRTGIGQAWFPKSWSDADIKNAGEFVANLSKNAEVPDGVWRFDEYNGVRVGVIKNDGEIGTIIPDNSRQP